MEPDCGKDLFWSLPELGGKIPDWIRIIKFHQTSQKSSPPRNLLNQQKIDAFQVIMSKNGTSASFIGYYNELLAYQFLYASKMPADRLQA